MMLRHSVVTDIVVIILGVTDQSEPVVPSWWDIGGSASILQSILIQVLPHVARFVAGLLQMDCVRSLLCMLLPWERSTVARYGVVHCSMVVDVVACRMGACVQTYRQTGRQTDSDRQTDRQTCACILIVL